MKVKEIVNFDGLDLRCEFYDYKGNPLGYPTAITSFREWETYTVEKNNKANDDATDLYKVRIIANKGDADKYFNRLKALVKERNAPYLLTTEEISVITGDDESRTDAWLWSCTKHGLTQREKPIDSDNYYWVVE